MGIMTTLPQDRCYGGLHKLCWEISIRIYSTVCTEESMILHLNMLFRINNVCFGQSLIYSLPEKRNCFLVVDVEEIE